MDDCAPRGSLGAGSCEPWCKIKDVEVVILDAQAAIEQPLTTSLDLNLNQEWKARNPNCRLFVTANNF